MKVPTITLCLIFAALTVLFSSNHAHGSLDLSGNWAYAFGTQNYFFRRGASQSGRFSNFGRGWYDYGIFGRASSGQNYLRNTSRTRASGRISLEFWQTPVYNGSRGFVKMLRGYKPLKPRFEYTGLSSGYGYSYLTFEYGYAAIFALDYTGGKWRFQDRINFDDYYLDD